MFMTYTLCAICIHTRNKSVILKELQFSNNYRRNNKPQSKKVSSLEKSRGNSSCEFGIYHVTRKF